MITFSDVRDLTLEQALKFYEEAWQEDNKALLAELGIADRFFLLTNLLGRADAVHPWVYERSREVEAETDGCIDIWSREHYKSTIVTFAGIVQEILKNPEITISIFSYNNKEAQKPLRQIKNELEGNKRLLALYPDILWRKPDRDAPLWSVEKGLIVRRKGNPKEATLEAHGLVDGMPTGSHFHLRVYDDVVTDSSVTTPEMMEKTTDAWRLSQNLGGGDQRQWHVGTYYHFADTYRRISDLGLLKVRLHPATEDGQPTGNPVLFTPKVLADKRTLMGPYVFACQLLCNPVADEAQGFKREWIRYHDETDGEGMNVYVLVDPASEKKKGSDYTACFVVGLGSDRNYYVLDIVRDRLNLTERADLVFRMHRKWHPIVVGYEKYGKDSDIQHFEDRMRREHYHFSIKALGGGVKKEDRIRRLIPLFENGRMYIPDEKIYVDYEGKRRDLIKEFIEQEYLGFPVSVHDDMLDCLARIVEPELNAFFPKYLPPAEKRVRERYRDRGKRQTSWMAA